VRKSGALENKIFKIAPDTYGLALWLGTRESNALDLALWKLLPQRQSAPHYWPFLIIKNVNREQLTKALEQIKNKALTLDDLAVPEKITFEGKYNDYVPEDLLKKQYLSRNVDLNPWHE